MQTEQERKRKLNGIAASEPVDLYSTAKYTYVGLWYVPVVVRQLNIIREQRSHSETNRCYYGACGGQQERADTKNRGEEQQDRGGSIIAMVMVSKCCTGTYLVCYCLI
jgi:hypothetical protein